MSLTVANNYSFLNYSINTSATVDNDTSTTTDNLAISQKESSNSSTNTRSRYHPNGEIKFVEEGNSGVFEGYVDGIKMDKNFMDILSMSASGASDNQLIDRINKQYDKTDAEKLEEIFGL